MAKKSRKDKARERAQASFERKAKAKARAQANAERKAKNDAANEELLNEVMAEVNDSPASPENPKGKNKILKRVGLILFIALNAAVIWYTASLEFSGKAPPPEKFRFTNILFLLGGIMCLVIVLACETVKYMLMMRHLGEKVSVRHAFSTAALGKYYDCITPSGAGGQPFQIYYLHSNKYSVGAASAMPLSGFFTMQFGFVILCVVAFIFGNSIINSTGLTGIKITAYVGAVAYTVVPVMIIISGVAPKIAMKIVAGVVRFGAKLHIVKNPNHTIMKSIRSLRNYSDNIKKITKDKALLIKIKVLSYCIANLESSVSVAKIVDLSDIPVHGCALRYIGISCDIAVIGLVNFCHKSCEVRKEDTKFSILVALPLNGCKFNGHTGTSLKDMALCLTVGSDGTYVSGSMLSVLIL